MRAIAAAALAVLLLALMPAFALLRYEHAASTVEPPGTGAPAAGEETGSVALGPSVWRGLGTHANAAPAATVVERSLALAALAHIVDSIPRPAGAPSPRWGEVLRENGPGAEHWHVVLAALLPKCAGVMDGEPCRDRATLTTVAMRVLSSGMNEADVLIRWTVSPGMGQGWFRVALVRGNGRWQADAVERHFRPPEAWTEGAEH